MSPARIAVLGGGYAGVLAARRLATRLGARAEVTLYAAGDQFVERIRLHQVAAGQRRRAIPLASLLGAARLEVATVRAIDPVARTVTTDRGVVRPDAVVNAVGSRSAPAVPGGAHALTLDGEAGAAAVARAVATGRPLAILGGGLTALELATELADAHRGLALALYTRGALGGDALGAAAVVHARAALARRGIAVFEGASVEAIEPDAIVVDGARIAVGGAVWCAGFAASPLAAAAGLAVDRQGRMLVTATLCVDDRGWLWGAGDAAVPAMPVGAPLHMACKTAMPMGRRAADNLAAVLAGAAPRPFAFGDSGVCVSLGRRDGVIQHRAADGRHTGVVRGRLGAWIKESVCRFTVRALRYPRVQAVFTLYDRRGRAVLAAAPPPRALPEPTA